jgi:Flp pilus assembly protein TadG
MMTARIASRRSSRRPRGQSLVEFALVLPIFLLVMMGIIDFGRAIFSYNSLSNATRDGARVAIVDQTVTAGIPAGAAEAAEQASAMGIDPATDVDVEYTQPDGSDCSADRSIGCIATVTVRYEFEALTPIVGRIVGPIDLEAFTSLVIENTKP